MPTRENEPSGLRKQHDNNRKASVAKPKLKKADKERSILAFVHIPLTYNDDTVVPQQVIDDIKDQIYLGFDGYTVEGTVNGAYKMRSTGQKRVEDTLKISIALKAGGTKQLETMASEWASELGQESILVTYTDFVVVFVEPNNGGI